MSEVSAITRAIVVNQRLNNLNTLADIEVSSQHKLKNERSGCNNGWKLTVNGELAQSEFATTQDTVNENERDGSQDVNWQPVEQAHCL